MMNENKIYDCVIIGGGIAGLTSALYAARGGLSTLVIEEHQFGGQIINALNVLNYPGYLSISGYDLITNLSSQVKNMNVPFLYETVVGISKNSVVTNEREIEAKTIIIATGLKKNKLGFEDDYIGRGVSYCATCDGNFFKGKNVAVVGGGNVALEDALYLANVASKVYLIHRRDSFRADDFIINKVYENEKIEVLYNREVRALSGDDALSSLTLDNGDEIEVAGLFIAVGAHPELEFLGDLIKQDSSGYIISENTETNISNIFVAGDARTKELRQLITAASDGAIAANKCINYINLNS